MLNNFSTGGYKLQHIRWFWPAFIALLLLITWLGMRDMNHDSLWFDEIWSTYYAGGAHYGPISLLDTVNRVASEYKHENNPPGYYLVLNAWGRFAGWSEFAGRMSALLIGILAVALIYRLGYDLTLTLPQSSRVFIGLGAAIALGASAFFIRYLHEMRAYAPMVTLSLAFVWMYWRLLNARKPSRALQMSFLVIIAVQLYTHFFMALVIAVLGLYHLLFAPKNRRWWQITFLAVCGGLLFIPWIGLLLRASFRAKEGLSALALTSTQLAQTLVYAFSNSSAALLALCLIAALCARGRHARFIWFMAAGGLIAAVLFNTVVPVITHVRYIIMLWPFFALLVGLGLEYLMRRGIPPVWLFGLWIVGGVWNSIDPAFNRSLHDSMMPWKEMRAELTVHGQPDDVVVFHSPTLIWLQEPEFEHYMYGLPMRHSATENIPGLQAKDDYFNHAQQFLADAPRVWLAVDQALPPNFRLDEFQRALALNYDYCTAAFNLTDMRLELYARHVDNPRWRFGDGIGLDLIEPLRVEPDGSLRVMLEISQTDAVPRSTYSLALHVEDSNNQLRAQLDNGLPADSHACALNTISVATLPAGDYTLLTTVYNARTGEKLNSPANPNGDHLNRLVIGKFKIQH